MVHKVGSIEDDTTLQFTTINQVVHAIESPQNRGLTASGRTNECGDLPSRYLTKDIADCFIASIADRDVVERKANITT